MKNYLLPILFFTTFSAIGQSFWSEEFSNGIPAGWITEDVNGQGVLWEFCNATDCNISVDSFKSATASTGFLLVKPPISNAVFKSTLSTAPIDCSDKEKVFLEFETFVHTWYVNAAKGYHLYVKNENEDWVQYDILPEQNKDSVSQFSHNPEKITIDISKMAAEFSSVQIRWEWTGTAEGSLALDDVKLFEKPPYYERVVWGNEPGQGDFDGGLNGWTVETLLPSKDSIVKWEWEPFGSVAKALSTASFQRLEEFRNFPYVNSYSNHNGAMVFNADFFNTNGSAPPPTSLNNYLAELTSPVIDLSNVQNEVNLRFEQLAFLGGMPPNPGFYPSITFYSYSLDGGATWGEPIAFNDDVEYFELIQNTQTTSLCGVAGTKEFRLKFTFTGELFFWAVDDIVLVEKDPYDLQIKSNFYSVAPNFQTPASQTEPIFFLVDIENFGSEKQENVVLSVDIVDQSNGQIVYQDSMHFDTIERCGFRQNEIFGRFVPPSNSTNYEVQYSILSNGVDPTPDNNQLSWDFEISENTYAKEDGSTTGIQPNDPSKGFEYGNCFYVEKGTCYEVDSLTFGLDNPELSAGIWLNINLYRFYGDTNDDDYIDETEYKRIGAGTYTVKGSENVLSNGKASVEIYDLSSFEVGVPLENGAYYLATVEYLNNDGRSCPIQASQAIDYSATYFMYDSLNLPRYAGIEKDASGRFDLLSLIDLTPVVRMQVNKICTNVDEIAETPLFISPNPTNNYFEIPSEFYAKKGTLELYDLKGRLLRKWKTNAMTRFSIQEFSNGVYFLKLKTEDAVFVGKIVKGSE